MEHLTLCMIFLTYLFVIFIFARLNSLSDQLDDQLSENNRLLRKIAGEEEGSNTSAPAPNPPGNE